MSIKSIVADSSALFALFFPEDYSDWCENEVKKYSEIHIPELAFLETSNAAWKRIVMFKQPSNIVLKNLKLLHEFMRNICITHRDLDYIQEAIKLSIKLKVTVYDVLFLSLAEKYGVKLLTIDRELVEKLKEINQEYRVLSPWLN
ncbi:MAG: type II toxin-antitoxin system VapC family toxin [archaeon GB-1867-035]|nr:type II toxin-antitoxin system VapC family toxin [Candidatus Culexmicrobium profundum]